jgi:hypothetical protein
MTSVHPDAAIRARGEDRLGRRDLATEMAQQIELAPCDAGFVCAIVGEWGSGKTSMLNLVVEALEGRKVRTFEFDPWLFSNTEELVTRFLRELGSHLLASESRRNGLGKAGGALLTYAEALEPLGWLPAVGVWATRASMLAKTANTIRSDRRKELSVDATRDAVWGALRELDDRVLVVMDDLDRLDAEQIRDIMRLVRLVANFPNVVYLLAYSRTAVERALSARPEEDTRDGAAYLEKIVQVPYMLPPAARGEVFAIFEEELEQALDGSRGAFDESFWVDVIGPRVEPFLGTVRAARRLVNVIPTIARLVKDEVAIVDVVALETLRLFAPAAWEQIPTAAVALTGARGEPGQVVPEDRRQRDKRQIACLWADADEVGERIEALIRVLFPHAARVLDDGIAPPEPTASDRVAHLWALQRYLRCVAPAQADAQFRIELVRKALDDTGALIELFESWSDQRVGEILESFDALEDDLDATGAESLSAALLSRLPGSDIEKPAFGRDVRREMRRVVWLLLFHSDSEEYAASVRIVFDNITILSGRLELLERVRGPGEWALEEESGYELWERLAKEVVARSARDLASEKRLFGLLLAVERDQSQDIHGVCRQRCADDRFLLQLLASSMCGSDPGDGWQTLCRWLSGEDLLMARITEVVGRTDPTGLSAFQQAGLQIARQYAQGGA